MWPLSEKTLAFTTSNSDVPQQRSLKNRNSVCVVMGTTDIGQYRVLYRLREVSIDCVLSTHSELRENNPLWPTWGQDSRKPWQSGLHLTNRPRQMYQAWSFGSFPSAQNRLRVLIISYLKKKNHFIVRSRYRIH